MSLPNNAKLDSYKVSPPQREGVRPSDYITWLEELSKVHEQSVPEDVILMKRELDRLYEGKNSNFLAVLKDRLTGNGDLFFGMRIKRMNTLSERADNMYATCGTGDGSVVDGKLCAMLDMLDGGHDHPVYDMEDKIGTIGDKIESIGMKIKRRFFNIANQIVENS